MPRMYCRWTAPNPTRQTLSTATRSPIRLARPSQPSDALQSSRRPVEQGARVRRAHHEGRELPKAPDCPLQTPELLTTWGAGAEVVLDHLPAL